MATAREEQKAPAEITPERFSEITLAIEAELSRFMVGQADLIRLTLIALIGGGHVLLEGVPGLGKTVLVRSLASVLDLDFARVQFTPDLMPADITGTHIVTEDDGGHRRFEFQPGPLFTNLLLADEINRATPKTQSALLEAMGERQVTVGDRTRKLAEIAKRTTGSTTIELSPVAGRSELAAMRELSREVPIASHVMDLAVALILATHPDKAGAPDEVKRYVRWGASPRGLQSLVLAARIRALLDGRFNVALEDLSAVAPAALRHRIFLNFEADAAGVASDAVVQAVISAATEGAKPR